MIMVALATSGVRAAERGPLLDQEGPTFEQDDPTPIPDGPADTGLPAEICDESQLVEGVQLPENPDLYTVFNENAAWGTPRMVQTLIAVSEEMAWRFPEIQPLVVGDISREGGGAFPPHRSHRGGIDVDLGLYNRGGKQGRGGFLTLPAEELDLDMNLAFVQALFATGNVERILLDRSLIKALRDHAIQTGAMTEDDARRMFILPEEAMERPFGMDQIVHHVQGHENHFHVRVYCSD